jgi:hypothetical protein
VQSGFDASSFGGLGQRHAKNTILRTSRLGQEKWEKESTWVCKRAVGEGKVQWDMGKCHGRTTGRSGRKNWNLRFASGQAQGKK